jgi:hypothetical protein
MLREQMWNPRVGSHVMAVSALTKKLKTKIGPRAALAGAPSSDPEKPGRFRTA